MPSLFHPPSLDQSNYTWERVQVMKSNLSTGKLPCPAGKIQVWVMAMNMLQYC
jgi:hypothetical protein